jgi:lysyl-tRNA synthetase class I
MKEPSDRQIAFAVRISHLTKKPMPTENTAQAYFIYIRDNIQEYQKLRRNYLYDRQRLREQQPQRIYNSVMDDEQDAAWAASMDFSWM